MDTRKRLTILAMLASLGLMTPAHAQVWPLKPVRIIWPYAPGTVGDGSLRVLAERLGHVFGQPFVVDARPGANGAIAAESVARSPGDGYTLLAAATPQMAIAPVMTKVSYDPVKDFVPISSCWINAFALVVNARMPVKTVTEFVDYVRARPNQLAYAEGGIGSIAHLSMALFLHHAGLEMTNLTYKGNVPALTDVVAGHASAMFSIFADALPHATSGSIRLLGVSSQRRSPRAPEVPTIAESGFPGFVTVSWQGLMGPAGLSRHIVDRIAIEVARGMKDPALVERLTRFGVDPLVTGPDEFAQMIAADLRLWREALKITGIKLESP